MKKQLLPVFTFAKIDIKRLFRDKLAMFFTFVFPLLFLFVFGGIFGRDNNSVSFNLALLNKSDNHFSNQFVDEAKKDDIFKIDENIKDMASAEEKMIRGEIDATIVVPESFGEVGAKGYPTGEIQVIYNKNSEQAGQTLASVLTTMFDEINKQILPSDKPFTVVAKSTAKAGMTNFDYVFAGLLGFSLMSLGIFGPASVFPKLKEKGVLRRYRTTTLKTWQYFIGNVLSNVTIGLMSITTMFVVGIGVFGLKMQGNWLVLSLLIVLSSMLMFGIGLAIGGWAKTERQAAPLTQIVTMPMMFLSGSFFPRFLFPGWLQGVTQYLPLTPVIDAARLVITEGRGVLELMPQFGLIVGWLVIIYLLAFRLFHWE